MRLERAQLALLAALAATASVSIFASETLLAFSVLLLAARAVRGAVRLAPTAVDTPLLALVVWTLLSACFAGDPVHSHEDSKKLLLFAAFYLALAVMARAVERERVLSAVLLGGLALATLMVVQHHFLGFDRLDRRPPGFLGHYMSASGVTMLALLLAASRLAFEKPARPRLRDLWLAATVLVGVLAVAVSGAAGHGVLATRLFVAGLAVLAGAVACSCAESARSAERALPLVVLPLAAWAAVVSQTRGVWIGVIVGLGVVALLRAPRLVAGVAAVVLALLVVRPGPLVGRLTLADASSLDRYYMWQAGIDIVLERPVFGIGAGMVESMYPSYRWPQAPNPVAPHLHNNLMQLAAERGVPGLAFFVWWAVAVFVASWRAVRATRADPDPSHAPAAVGTFAALTGVFAAGLFEYNLGDSEVLMLVLLLTAVPFALARSRA